MHVLLKEAIEVLHAGVAKDRSVGADLVDRENAERPLREGQANIDLTLDHCLLVFTTKGSLERSHPHSELSRDGCEPKLHVAVRGKDEVMRNACGIVKKGGIEAPFWRRSHCADLGDDLILDCRQLACRATFQICSLQAERQ